MKRKNNKPVVFPAGRYRLSGFTGALCEIVLDCPQGLTVTRSKSLLDYTQEWRKPWRISGFAKPKKLTVKTFSGEFNRILQSNKGKGLRKYRLPFKVKIAK